MGKIMSKIDMGLRRIAGLGGDPQFAGPEFTNADTRQYILAGPDVKDALTEEIEEGGVFLIPAQARGGTPMMMPPRDVLRYRGLTVLEEQGRPGFLSVTYMTAGGQKELILLTPEG